MAGTDVKEIILRVNGTDAQKKIDDLTRRIQHAQQERQRLEQAHSSGQPWTQKETRAMQTYSKEIETCTRRLNRMQATGDEVGRTLRNMSSAGINDLKRAIQSMERTLNSGRIARGSKEWETLTGSIRQCRTELEKLQAERRSMETRWEKLNRLFNDWAGSIAAATAAVTGVVMAGRSAVSAYVEMDEELAQVTKFTGLSKKELEELQEEFKKMDTRSSRIELNKLAEEAGRLGKTSVEDVLGFVKAADVINVALDDLGDGATLTLSKLTNIFGDEERLGTEKALLSVGSVINELSQNCTASAPYLANFAQRLAGVGAQAKMTIPQIMAFGAVLDSQGQACEMSATAFSELTMKLFKEPEKIAKATGIPLQTLNEELKKSTADGLMLLLNRLHELGNIDVLAPLLKEMGENGTRASGVIAALAGNVDTLKWQLGEAQKAYDDGTSVTKEFAVQNNTLQAGLDKAKKRLNEIAIDLGQKLMPVMTHVVSSTSLLLKAVSALVTFFIKYRVTIATATAAFVAYKIAVEAANIAFKVHYAWLVVVNAAQKVGAAIMATYKTAVLACTVAYNKMTGNIERAAAAQRLMNTTMKANVYALAAAAIAALVVQIYNHTKALTSEEKAEKAVTNVRTEAIKKVQEEKINLETLRAAAMDEKLSLDERKTAIDKLNKVVPNYNAFLDKTTGKYHENKAALDDYINSLIRQYEIMGAKDKLAEIGRQKAELRIEQAKARKDLENANKRNRDVQNTNQMSYSGSVTGITMGQTTAIAQSIDTSGIERMILKIGAQFNDLVAEENLILEIWGNDMKKEAVKPPTPSDAPTYDANAPGTGSGSGKSGSGSNDKADKKEEERIKNELARIKALQQQKETLALTEYMTGKTDYKTYQEELMKIDAWSIIERQKLYKEGSNEWIELEHERVEKMQTALEKHHAWSIEELKRRQAAELRAEKESYAAGAYTKEVHEETVKQIQLRHLKDRVELLKSLNMDYYEAEQEYNDAVVEDQIEKREKLVEKMEELRKKYMEKEKVTKESEIKAAEELALKLGWTEEQKQKLIAAIREKYDETEKKQEKELLENIGGQTDEITSAFISIGDAFADMQKRIAKGGKATWEDYARMAMGALNMVMATMSAASNLMQANSDLEVAKIEKRYETEIEAAGKNRKKVEALEKQKEDEIAKVKSEHQRKATKIQIAQAVAQTAMAAISAYASAASIPVVGWIMAPIAAALATAAGAIQIATIKKQAQAQALGYEKGGFTGGNSYKKEAGIVHEGEFVANHDAVNNRELLPLLETIDRAQRNNTVGSLTAKDVSASLPASNSSSANTTTVIVRAAKSAYASAASIPVVGWIMAPIAAALATAAGAIQIAKIKKQAQAQALGYEKGGFTGGNSYRKEAGIVHGGEFVANHDAVNNRELLPLLETIERAQRNNTVASLTAKDVSASLPASNSSSANTTTVIVRDDAETKAAVGQLTEVLAEGIDARVIIDGPNGLDKQWRRYKQMKGRK